MSTMCAGYSRKIPWREHALLVEIERRSCSPDFGLLPDIAVEHHAWDVARRSITGEPPPEFLDRISAVSCLRWCGYVRRSWLVQGARGRWQRGRSGLTLVDSQHPDTNLLTGCSLYSPESWLCERCAEGVQTSEYRVRVLTCVL